MSIKQGEGTAAPGGAEAELSEPIAAATQEERTTSHLALEDYLPSASAMVEAKAPAAPALVGMRTARVLVVKGRKAEIALRGQHTGVEAEIAPEVDAEVIADARDNGDLVLVEIAEGETPLVVGALQTRRPREIRLKAATVHIEGDEELLLRSGRGAIRIRQDGDIEVVGSRISASSRGLFRIVGRLLRLN